MKILGISASSSTASIALFSDGQLEERQSPSFRAHTEFVNVAIDELISNSGFNLRDLHLIALDNGPGSFTGVRVAVNVARALSYSFHLPIFEMTSLKLMMHPRDRCVVMVNAFKNLVFFQAFENGEERTPPVVLTPEGAQAWIKAHWNEQNFSVSGNGALSYPNQFPPFYLQLQNPDFEFCHPSAKKLVELASRTERSLWTNDWKLVLPLYLRDSAAEENLRK